MRSKPIKFLNYIEKGKENTDLVIGGEQIKIDGKGCFIQPTIFNNVNSNDVYCKRGNFWTSSFDNSF